MAVPRAPIATPLPHWASHLEPARSTHALQSLEELAGARVGTSTVRCCCRTSCTEPASPPEPAPAGEHVAGRQPQPDRADRLSAASAVSREVVVSAAWHLGVSLASQVAIPPAPAATGPPAPNSRVAVGSAVSEQAHRLLHLLPPAATAAAACRRLPPPVASDMLLLPSSAQAAASSKPSSSSTSQQQRRARCRA